jgi:hypothetical protein
MIWGSKRTENAIRDCVSKAVGDALEIAKDNLARTGKIADLQREIVKLEIDRDKKVEEFSRKEREIEHKIGLERKRQEFEIEQSKRETTVKVREENLAADKERFKSEMDFQRKHLEGEIASLRELVGEMLKRLPNAEIMMEVKRGR